MPSCSRATSQATWHLTCSFFRSASVKGLEETRTSTGRTCKLKGHAPVRFKLRTFLLWGNSATTVPPSALEPKRNKWNQQRISLSHWHVAFDSSHLSILLPSCGQVAVAAGQAGFSICLCAQQRFPALPGGSWGIPKPDEICNPSSVFWVCPGFPSHSVVPEKPPEGGAHEAS